MTKEQLQEDIAFYYKSKEEDASCDTSLLDLLTPEERNEWNAIGQKVITDITINAKQYGIEFVP